ncbi:winged helix DNA-binding protein [Taklimakanibacter deserti]|uniref:winged helix DNA-binding protein n=1 Tax=Taklimakanibacter deserti TaxID=2267839 RepID=UPI000E64AB8C
MKTAVAARSHQADEELVIKGEHFAQMLQSIELLHRRFLDVITVELGQRNKTLSSVQALILSHAHGMPISLGELQALGHYEGTNLAYNVGKLAAGGYITLARPQWDKRSSLIELTEEGRDVAQIVAQLLMDHAGLLPEIGISAADLSLTTRMLNGLNRLWSA